MTTSPRKHVLRENPLGEAYEVIKSSVPDILSPRAQLAVLNMGLGLPFVGGRNTTNIYIRAHTRAKAPLPLLAHPEKSDPWEQSIGTSLAQWVLGAFYR